MRRTFALLATLGLAACGGSDPASNTAEKLEEAAAQSDPAAAAELENAADQIEDMNLSAPLGAPGSPAQDAMSAAGNAQAATLPQPQEQPGNTAGNPPGAKPHEPGDPVPPPKIVPQEK